MSTSISAIWPRMRICRGISSDDMKIAKPMLMVMTPIGVGWGLVEAWRFRPILAMLMALLLGVVASFIWLTVRTIRTERANSR